MRIYHLITLLFLALLVTACGTIVPLLSMAPAAAPAAENPADPARIERGVEVYLENYCGICHILTVANTRGTFGPHHDNAGTIAEYHITLDSYRGEATTATEYIRESLLNPGVFYTPGYEATSHHMPAFTHLPEDDIEALVYLLINQRGE
jgi:mono/diheme cytochrome c family protein